jgi:hypothetical protein
MPYLHWNTTDNQESFREAFRLLVNQYKDKETSGELLDRYTVNRCRSVYPFDDELPYHPTRTLDQYFCQNLDTDRRDAIQVCDKKLLVIDQLWIMLKAKEKG